LEGYIVDEQNISTTEKDTAKAAVIQSAICKIRQDFAIEATLAVAAGERIDPQRVYHADNERGLPPRFAAKARIARGYQRMDLEVTYDDPAVMRRLYVALEGEAYFIDAREMRMVGSTLYCTINGLNDDLAHRYGLLPPLRRMPVALVGSDDPLTVQIDGIPLVRLGGAIGCFSGLLAQHLTQTCKGLTLPIDAPFPHEEVVDVKGELVQLKATPTGDFSGFRLEVSCDSQPITDQFALILQMPPYLANGFRAGTPDISKGATGFTCEIRSNVLTELEAYNRWLRAQPPAQS
jgi:hypothetical protein